MKSVMLSIKPYWVFLIIAKTMGWTIDKQKTVEVRKSYPKDKVWNKTVILYCTKDKTSFNLIPKEYQPLMKKFLGKVIGEFVCDKIYDIAYNYFYPVGYDVSMGEISRKQLYKMSCLEFIDFDDYLGWENGYGWHISDLVIYDKPKVVSEFEKTTVKCHIKDGFVFSSPEKQIFKLKRPPQSWCYVEELR